MIESAYLIIVISLNTLKHELPIYAHIYTLKRVSELGGDTEEAISYSLFGHSFQDIKNMYG